MITRIEIDGFKSFLDFELDVPPFLALVGPNSSGKSNLFDAVDFVKAACGGRNPLLNARRGKPHELRHRDGSGQPVRRFSMRVDALARAGGRLLPLSFRAGSGDGVAEWYGDVEPPGEELITDGEIDSWRLHVPEPVEMRRSVSAADVGPLKENAGNLAAVLGRMKDTPDFDDLIVDLAALVPDVKTIRPVFDERDQEWSFDVVFVEDERVPSRLVSDGTLRVLALLAALYDPQYGGVNMVEEVENGLHPSRLVELLRRTRRLVSDPREHGAADRPLRQIILTTHSPVVVSELYRSVPESLVFLDAAVRTGGGRPRSRVSVALPIGESGEPGTYVSPRQVRKYLNTVDRALR